jgi:uncharacterized protein
MYLAIDAGFGKCEDLPSMAFTHPLYDDYWESKRARIENIDIPIYVLGSYS